MLFGLSFWKIETAERISTAGGEDAMLLHDRLVNKYRAVSAAISWSCCLYELDWVERKRKPFYGLLLICLQIVIVPAGATKCNELKRFQG